MPNGIKTTLRFYQTILITSYINYLTLKLLLDRLLFISTFKWHPDSELYLDRLIISHKEGQQNDCANFI